MGLNHGLPINHFYIFEHWAQPSIEDYFDCIWTYVPNLCCYNGRLHVIVYRNANTGFAISRTKRDVSGLFLSIFVLSA